MFKKTEFPALKGLEITRPIIFFDLETTGVDVAEDRIVEIALLKYHPDGRVEDFHSYIDPERAIPKAASDVHGVTAMTVLEAPTFKDIAPALNSFFADSDIGGYNSNNFDIKMLFREFERAGIFFNYTDKALLDVCNIFKLRENRTLTAAVKFYVNEEIEEAHTAMGDVISTVKVLNGQFEKYDDLEPEITALARYSCYDQEIVDVSGNFYRSEKTGEIHFAKGKHKGKRCIDCRDYLRWMAGEESFPMDTKYVIKCLLRDGKY